MRPLHPELGGGVAMRSVLIPRRRPPAHRQYARCTQSVAIELGNGFCWDGRRPCPPYPYRELKLNVLGDPEVGVFLKENNVRVRIDLTNRRGPRARTPIETDGSGIRTMIPPRVCRRTRGDPGMASANLVWLPATRGLGFDHHARLTSERLVSRRSKGLAEPYKPQARGATACSPSNSD